ncbi:hypothetical protein [Streptomyces caatingaensis]|uniref:Uncharacterized protein n=1 Tax=Streptomyces caatingaensis TaxID=1678637 RepID=A0A0K9XAG9_9ACTN|nr:hypothetical protein [Streptomyces caatingaensis]KNB50101.1 hypothetical protein AC230_25710 [Streptomyces caatingaensis]
MRRTTPQADVTYRALFCDLLTDRVIDALPLTDVEFDDYIGKAGSLRGTVPLPDEALARRARAALRPGRTAVWLERGSEIWWGGILWTTTASGDERGRLQVQIQAGTFDSYLDHRILPEKKVFKNRDQFDIVRELISDVQSQRGGNIGITFTGDMSHVEYPEIEFAYTDLMRVQEIIDNLGKRRNGFEWRIHCFRDPGTGRRVKRLQLGCPKIEAGREDIVLDRPGQILTYSLPSDATVQANVVVIRGESANRDQASASVPQLSDPQVQVADLEEGWPRLEFTDDQSGVQDKALLDDLARAALDRMHRPEFIPEVTIRMDDRISPALIGSRVRLRIRDGWHEEAPDRSFRVVGLSVSPPSRGKAETAKLILEEKTYGRDSS